MANQIETFNQYNIVEYTTALVDDFYELYVSIHGKCFSKEHFVFKANTSFTGHSIIGYIAYAKDTNEVAAFYGVYPVYVNYQNNKILAAQSADTLTHVNHRRRGLFEKLFELTKEKCKTLSVQFIFGFPNPNSAPGFKKFGWSFYPKKKNFQLQYERTFFDRIKNKLFPNYSFNGLKRCEILGEEVGATGFQSDIIRSLDYFNYKSKLSNAKFYKLNTCVIWAKTEKDTITIGDIKMNEDVSIENVVFELKFLLERFNLRNLFFSFNNWNKLSIEFEKRTKVKLTETDFIVISFNDNLKLETLQYSKVDEDTF